MSEKYKIVYKGGEGEIVEKKSRFIAYVKPVNSEEEAAVFIESIKKKNWDARHNCSAVVIGEHNEFTRCNDDGEPSSTAGKPMLEVLINEGIHNVAVVVTRYFGGILLGTGGLVRAYQAAVKAGINASVIAEKQKGVRYVVNTDYNGIGKIQYIAASMDLFVADTKYTEEVEMELMIADELEDAFIKKVTEGTNGRARITKKENISYVIVEGRVEFC
ncbi:MAG: YigZ family protein [Lachnospiraceae bacterium]|nr:YigZ family protein [Lachnospiraceae bacterium]